MKGLLSILILCISLLGCGGGEESTYVKNESVSSKKITTQVEDSDSEKLNELKNQLFVYLFVFGVGYFKGYKSGKRVGSRKGFAAGRGSQNCFVATAAAGSPNAPEVIILRRFRDEVMLKYTFGVWLVNLYYYRLGPPMAEFIDSHPSLQRVVLIMIIRPISKFVSFFT